MPRVGRVGCQCRLLHRNQCLSVYPVAHAPEFDSDKILAAYGVGAKGSLFNSAMKGGHKRVPRILLLPWPAVIADFAGENCAGAGA